MTVRSLCLVALCAGAMAACASRSDQDDAATTASRFLDADPAAACALLTPRTRAELETSEGQPCEQALPDLGGTVRQADTWSDRARVVTDNGAVYLTEFDTGWLVSAAGCRPDGDAPDFCVLGG